MSIRWNGSAENIASKPTPNSFESFNEKTDEDLVPIKGIGPKMSVAIINAVKDHVEKYGLEEPEEATAEVVDEVEDGPKDERSFIQRMIDAISGFFGGKKEEKPEEMVLQQSEVCRYGVFDVETRRSAAEVGGWHRAERMGISIAVLYDSGPDQFFVYRDDEIDDLVERLRELDLVVGFNNKRFDNRVLSAYTSFDLSSLPTLDILEEVKNRLGYRISLDGLAGETLGVKKTADGLMALQWYKEGRIDLIIEYCRKDVEVTRDLFLFGQDNGYLLFKNKSGSAVRCPVDFGR